jgi:hypothetical protein
MAEAAWRTSCCENRMSRPIIAIALTAAASIAALPAHAQQQERKSTNPPTASVTLRGCVAESMGRYMLDKATVIAPKATAVPSPSADPSAVKTADVQPYELIGGQAKAHVGHQVEIVGTMRSDSGQTAAQPTAQATPTAHPTAGRVAIKSLKVLQTTCP